MSCMEVILYHRPISGRDNSRGITLNRAPKIAHHCIKIVYCFDFWYTWPRKKNGAGAKEGFHVICNISEPIPHNIRHGAFPAKIWKGRL